MDLSVLHFDPTQPPSDAMRRFMASGEFCDALARAINAVSDIAKAELNRHQALLFAESGGEVVGVIFYNLQSSAFLDPGDYRENFLFVADTLSDEQKQLVADKLRNESIWDNDY